MTSHPGEKKTTEQRDTIVALSTALGRGAIAIVRLSGGLSWNITEKIFRPRNPMSPIEDRMTRVGCFVSSDGEPFDEGMAVVMRAPHSFTGEHMAEFHCHGGPAVIQALLSAAREAGARPATPGEFTRRAFLEGKMDLLQCESVADLISAETARAARAALSHLSGALSRSLESVWDDIVEAGAHLEAAIDFSDEFEPGSGPAPTGVPMSEESLMENFAATAEKLKTLENTYSTGRMLREGARVAILGRPNAGKSTLLNCLLGADRAIVSPTPGTTRDTVEETCDIGGIPVKLIDTAGLRETNEEIEGEGVFRARQAASVADLCLVVADASCGPEEIRWAEDEISKLGSPSMLVVNKIDLDAAVLPPESAVSSRLYVISALEGSGLDRLRDAIAVLLSGSEKDNFDPDQAILLRERHRDLVVRCRKALEGGRDALEQGVSPELVAVDLNEAQRALSELLGRDYGPALLDKIFLTFCIGK